MSTTILLIIAIVLIVVNILLTIKSNAKDNSEELKANLIKLDADLSRIDPLVRNEFGRNREENQRSFKENREELNNSFKLLGETLTKTVAELFNAQKGQFDTFSNRQEQIRKETEERLKEIRETVERRLQTLQEENGKKLEEMRKVVDEKLQETVEKRFNESFRLISERLEQVHKGLGEMQSLASGVGDLKKVLTNVKTRGNLGEIQLGAILEQILSPEQYEQNAIIKEGSQERVEYVIKLPGKNNDNKSLLLPVDSKFPNEDYQRLLETYDNIANLSPRDIESVTKQFENSVKKNAKDIRDKYINPPVTTDFAIMFVPTEG
jgi:DNA recombination protein RmuC